MDGIPDVWKTWVCRQCTFRNLQTDDGCLVCDAPQDAGGEEGKGDEDLKQTDTASPIASPTSPASAAEKWVS